ncbi:MAG: N-formylglutamate amidohydrolase [Planctomycetota bacterium]
MKAALLLSCEHGGNRVPRRQAALFRGARRELDSHAGWDPGALVLARELARAFRAPLFATTATRLLVDANRSAEHPRLFSAWSRSLPAAERARILARWWAPHRAGVEAQVAALARRRLPVLHLSVHSFTPRWKGRVRDVDIGFLHDPARPGERAFVAAWMEALAAFAPALRLRRNRPYRGTSDGLTTSLRARFGARVYLGIELEVSQRFPLGPPGRWRLLRRQLRESLAAARDGPPVA